ncbi:hypothetical protein J4573_45345 [Actinomadura barringtoniae]|uniref:Uncharacterized protein n=1 Tax=Actinomadura barringtoniae TaxID=1427535 RepID=A0A939PKM6_9ACTN|nr:hypothetical protein [Actinomadura barringtoniae]MBO2454380.1 hypothetical protein [Actinomadura barringtoniae]
MKLIIRVEGADTEAELNSLYRWLRDEDELRGVARLNLVNAPPVAGEMGGTLEAIQAVFDSGMEAGSLAVALISWLESRRHRRSAQPAEPAPPTRPELILASGDSEFAATDASPEEIKQFLETSDDHLS